MTPTQSELDAERIRIIRNIIAAHKAGKISTRQAADAAVGLGERWTKLVNMVRAFVVK